MVQDGASRDDETPPCEPTQDIVLEQHAETPVGPYRLVRKLGEGGMGMVFLAEQKEPVERLVALKIVRPGMDSERVLLRFEAERHALSVMDHPHVAKVLDAGATSDGRPYFVMELVPGIAITQYCDAHTLSIRERVALFIPVCQAVQHAHQKGIIHRDIKPSNVLVAEFEGQPVPKVIDFGVAKATDQQRVQQQLSTQFGQVVGTLEYMSPEQARLNPADVDTRSDVYSLGAVLYELLTGATPFDRQQLYRGSVDEALHLIGVKEPCRPSERLRGSESLPSVASRRRVEPHRLADLLRGELDWIVMKALEKDRSQRYESAAALARDIENYLADRPVSAGPPSVGYRVRKFVRRNRHMLAMAATLMTVLVLGAGVALQEAVLAKREAARADVERARAQATLRAALRAVNELYIGVADKHLMATPMREPMKLDLLRGAIRFYAGLADMHATDVEFCRERALAHSRLGSAYQWLGMLEVAESEHLQALEEMRRLAEESPGQLALQLELARCYLELGHVLTARAKLGRAELAYERSLALLAAADTWRPADPGYLFCLASAQRALGCHWMRERRYELAEEHLRGAAANFEQLVRLAPHDMSRRFHAAQAFRDLAGMLDATGRYEEADARYHKSIELQQDALAAPPIDADCVLHLALTHAAYGSFCERLGRVEEAASQHRQSLIVSSELAESYPHVPAFRDAWRNSYFQLVQLLARSKRSATAEHTLEEVIRVAGHLVARWPTVASYRQQLCHAYIDLAQLMEGEERALEAEWLLRSAMIRAEQLVTEHDDDPATRALLARSLWHLGAVLRCERRFAEAEQAFCEAMMFTEQLVAEIPSDKALYLEMSLVEQNAAQMLQEAGRRQEAEGHYLRCIAIQEGLAADHTDHDTAFLASSCCGLASLQLDIGRDREAESYYRRAITLTEDLIDRFPCAVLYQDRMAETLGGLLRVVNRRHVRGDEPGSEELLDSILAITRRVLNHDRVSTLYVLYRIAAARLERQQYEAAHALFTEVRDAHQRVLGGMAVSDDSPPLNHTARMNALAWLLANCPDPDLRNPQDAVIWATRAVERDPGNGVYQNTLGVALYRAGAAERAIEVLRRAVDMSFGTAADFFCLSMAHCHEGRLAEGLEWYRQAVDWMDRNDPDNPELLLMRAESEQLLGTWGVATVR